MLGVFGMKTRKYKGVYVQALCCTYCRWFAKPKVPEWFIDNARTCCPKCASDVTNARGRYIFEETTSFFGLRKSSNVIDYELSGNLATVVPIDKPNPGGPNSVAPASSTP